MPLTFDFMTNEALAKLDAISKSDYLKILKINGLAFDLRNDEYHFFDDKIISVFSLLKKVSPGVVLSQLEDMKTFGKLDPYFEFTPRKEYTKKMTVLSCEKYRIVEIDGKSVENTDQLFSIFKDSLEFPFFGWNWNALEDCLSDLSWLEKKDFAVFIKNYLKIREKEVFEYFPEVMVRAAQWARHGGYDMRIYILTE